MKPSYIDIWVHESNEKISTYAMFRKYRSSYHTPEDIISAYNINFKPGDKLTLSSTTEIPHELRYSDGPTCKLCGKPKNKHKGWYKLCRL